MNMAFFGSSVSRYAWCPVGVPASAGKAKPPKGGTPTKAACTWKRKTPFLLRRWLLWARPVCALGLLICSGRLPAQQPEGQKQASRPESPVADAVNDAGHAKASTDNDAIDDMERRLGTRSVHIPGDPMKVIFIEGRYIDAPYHLMRRGLAIYVNGIEVERVEWLNRYYVAEDPPLPEGLNADSRLAEIEPWMCKKAGYYRSHFPPEEAVQKAIEAFRGLPCVKQAGLQLPSGDDVITRLHVELRSGETIDWANEAVDLRPRREETVRRWLEWSMEQWQESLDAPGLLYHAHGQLYGYPSRSLTWSALPEIVAVLKSNRSPKEKAASLQPFFPDRFSDAEQLQRFLKPLLADFHGSPQLDTRIELIGKVRRHAPNPN